MSEPTTAFRIASRHIRTRARAQVVLVLVLVPISGNMKLLQLHSSFLPIAPRRSFFAVVDCFLDKIILIEPDS